MVTATRSAELEEFAREGRRRFGAGDLQWFGETTAQGEVGSFGTAAEEQVRGRDAVLALMEEIVPATGDVGSSGSEADDEPEDEIEAYEAGDTGWIVTHGRFTLDDGSSVGNRVVNVVVRDPDGGGWKSVLVVSQILVANELLEPGSPLLTPAER
ncbi:MAG TPA: hypothetical protein VGH79_03770 [Gaiellaceae bacterium]|jgi:hypothetical protein